MRTVQRALQIAVLCVVAVVEVTMTTTVYAQTVGEQVVGDSVLLDDLWGWGRGTTGGLGGQIYVVNRRDDQIPPKQGMLRYGLTELKDLTDPTKRAERVWIVFDHTIFPPETPTTLHLQPAPLVLHDNVTIDGRGSHVVLVRLAHWADVPAIVCTFDAPCPQGGWISGLSNAPEAPVKTCVRPLGSVAPMLQLGGVHNVIISHLDFEQHYVGAPNPPIPSGWALDKECFGDVISIHNSGTKTFGNIWINASNFKNCADECIGVTHGTHTAKAYLTISRNKFVSTGPSPVYTTFKAILLGGLATDDPFGVVASVYLNRFIGVKERQPRVGKAYAHVFNNLYEDWKGYAVGVHNSTRVMVEHNVFRAVTTTQRAWSLDSMDDARLYVRRNVLSSSAITGTQSGGFPACASAGGPWYYECLDSRQMLRLSGLSYATAYMTLRARAGWQNVPNDVF